MRLTLRDKIMKQVKYIIVIVVAGILFACSTTNQNTAPTNQTSWQQGYNDATATCSEVQTFMSDYSNDPDKSFRLLSKVYSQQQAIAGAALMNKETLFSTLAPKCLNDVWKPEFCKNGYNSYVSTYGAQNKAMSSQIESSYKAGFNSVQCTIDVRNKLIGYIAAQTK